MIPMSQVVNLFHLLLADHRWVVSSLQIQRMMRYLGFLVVHLGLWETQRLLAERVLVSLECSLR